MKTNRLNRVGFTLVELLVVIAIIAIMIALLLPAVQRVRDNANNTACANNLRQLGLALIHFDETRGCYPPGMVIGPNQQFNIPIGCQHFWPPFILAEIDQESIYRKYHFDKNYTDVANKEAYAGAIPTFLCPAVPFGDRVRTLMTTPSGNTRVGDLDYHGLSTLATYDSSLDTYLTSSGDVRTLAIMCGANGTVLGGRPPRSSDVRDGLSQTILLVERAYPGLEHVSGPRVGRLSWGGGTWASENSFGIQSSNAQPVAAGLPPSYSLGNCVVNCNNQRTAYSFHNGGANAVMADGSVTFLKENLPPRIMGRLATFNGGEVLNADDY